MNTTTTNNPAKTRSWRRIAIYAILSVTVLVIVFVLGVNLFLNSSQARQVAASQLTDIIGMPVEVESLSVGTSQTEISLKSVVPGQDDPLFSIASVTADVSLLDLISGDVNPSEIVLRGVKVVVPLDRDGKLLAELPKASDPGQSTTTLPTVRIDDAEIRVRQRGRPEFVIQKLQLNASTRDKKYIVSGHFDDPQWKRWSVECEYQLDGDAGSIVIANQTAPLVPDLLKSIPYVPPETWEHASATGESAADIRINFGKDFTYTVTLTPAGKATLTLPDIDAPLANLSGTVRATGESVTIEKCEGSLAGGIVKVDGTLDFGPATSKLQFKVAADGLDLKKLPAEWGLPQQITGKLRGNADLTLTVTPDGKLHPQGGGEATIVDAKVAGLPAEVKLRLHGDGTRYRFQSEKVTILPRAEPFTVPIDVILQEPPPEKKPDEKPEPKPEATTLDASVALRDVEVSELLKQLEVKIPYALAGKVTVQVALAVPVGEVTDRSSYRFTGTLTSPAFRFEGLEVRDVSAVIRYQDGVLTLTELKAKFPAEGGQAGSLLGTAKAQVEPRGDLTASLTITDIPSGEILKAVPGVKLDLNGAISGKGDLSIPINDLKDTQSWSASASLSAKTLTTKSGTIENLSARATLDKGMVKLTEAKADLFKGTINGTADVPLSDAASAKLLVEFKDVDSGAVTRMVPGFPVPLTGRISGKLDGSAEPVKDGKPRVITADLNLNAPKMTVRGIPAERLTGKITVVKSVAEYSLEGHTLGGTFDVKGRYPATPANKERSYLRLRKIDLSRLGVAMNNASLRPLSGIINLNFEFDPEFSAGDGRLELSGLKWGRDPLAGDLSGAITLTKGAIDLRNFGGNFARGRLRIRARYDIEDPRRNFYNITLDRASIKLLAGLIPMKSPDGEASLIARGKLFGPTAASNLTLTLSGINLGGLPVTQVNIPIVWTGSFDRGRIVLRNGGGHIGNGKLTGNVTYDYGAVSRLGGDIRFQNVQIRSIIGSSSTFGNGRVSGRIDLGGEIIRSVDDITATLNARLNQTSVREVPLISVVSPFLQPIGLLKPFDSGEVKGRLSKGVFRLERFALSNPAAHLFAEGSITLKGRVDLDVIAATGQVTPNPRLLQLVGVAAIGPLPLVTIQRVSDLLSNRMVRLSVTGTIASPHVQLNKAALLTDTAVRFFLGTYIVPSSVSGSR